MSSSSLQDLSAHGKTPLVASTREVAAQVNGSPRDVEAAHVSFQFGDMQRSGGLNLEWRGVECFVSEPVPEDQTGCARKVCQKLCGFQSDGPPTKQIMKGACGFARSGEVLALMGPSGSGKTTLLNVLAQRPTLGRKGHWHGELLINGNPPWDGWQREMAYVMQKDIFYDELKVKENLTTSALLRLPYNWPESRRLSYLEKIVQDLGLDKVADTKIGTAIERGLSGGEVKRTSIANEFLARPRIFLLDEPLTGLDSSRAVEVMKSLQDMARKDGTTVMLTIHQPSSALYECFDRLLLLGPGGRTAYFGTVDRAVAHFSQPEVNLPLKADWSPSDHFIEVLATPQTCAQVCDFWEATQNFEVAYSTDWNQVLRDKIAKAFNIGLDGLDRLDRKVLAMVVDTHGNDLGFFWNDHGEAEVRETPNPDVFPLAIRTQVLEIDVCHLQGNIAAMPPVMYQTRVLLPRAFKRISRSYLKMITWKLHIALSVVWGFIYFGVGAALPGRIQDFVGAVFFIVAHWSWTPLFQGLGNFPREKEMLTKEKASKVYDIKAYFVAQVVAEAPLLLVFPIVFFAIIWPAAALPGNWILQAFGVVAVNIQVCSALSMLISALCMDQDMAISVAIVVMVFQMCAGGYFADMRLLPWWIGWVRFTSFYYYTFGSILRLLLKEPYGEALHLKATAKYSFSELGYAWELAVLLLMGFSFRVLAYLQLRYSRQLEFS